MIEILSSVFIFFVLGWHFYSKKICEAKIKKEAVESALHHSVIPFLDDMIRGTKDKYFIVRPDFSLLHIDEFNQDHTIDKLLTPSIETLFLEKCEEVFTTAKASFLNYCEHKNANYHVKIIPLSGGVKGDVSYLLVHVHDISMIVNERERKIEDLNQLVDLLVSIVDRKDHHTKEHSVLLKHFVEQVGRGLKFDTKSVDKLVYSAALLNFGKILVPDELLKREGHLKPKEKKIVYQAMDEIATSLKGAKMFLPVSKILTQTVEKMKTPTKEVPKFSKEARLLYHMNRFIALVSPRQHRDQYTIEAALDEVLKACTKKEDQQVYDALVFYLNDAGGRAFLR